ncbi:hypothetical protein PRZ48_008037 [Zasmidium cellare]|uniref:Uncharacterized protein n=1 Tax=Zasmidium cellare TaxID=395010 RepID=A0ABR0EF37_ZASCE|nr:hypothetical protein PRZ48_008037 [Zasmidium cellare]
MPEDDFSKELPSLASVYKLYDDDKLQDFVDGAETLLEEDVYLNRFHTIELLLLLANSVEDPSDTLDYYQRAESEYRMGRIYHHNPDEVRLLDELGVKLERIRLVVERERAEAMEEEDARDNPESPAHQLPNLSFSDDCAGGPKVASEDPEERVEDENESIKRTMELRPKLSKFEGRLKLKGAKSQKSKSDLRSMSSMSAELDRSKEVKMEKGVKFAPDERTMEPTNHQQPGDMRLKSTTIRPQRSDESDIAQRDRRTYLFLRKRLRRMLMPAPRPLERTGTFWELAPEIRQRIFETAFSDQILLIKTSVRRACEIQGYIYARREFKALNNLLVCKEFYAEASKVLLDTATFAFEGPIQSHEMSWLGHGVAAPIPEMTLVTHPRNLRRIRSFRISGRSLRYLIGQSVRWHMDLHRVVLEDCNAEDLGFTVEQRKAIEDCGEDDCSALTARLRCQRYDHSIDLPWVEGLRDIEIPQAVCRTCKDRGRVCKSILIQMEIEMKVLRSCLRWAEEKKRGPQVRALRKNIEKRQRVWEETLTVIESKAKEAKAKRVLEVEMEAQN